MMTLNRVKTAALLGAVIVMTGCASGPDTRAPERGERAEEGDRKRRPGGASPAVASHPIGLVFTSMDSNGDGLTSREELALGTAKHWASFNGQERLSAVRFSEWSLRELGSIDAMPNFFAFDRDFSTTITQDEFAARLSEDFTRMDTNGDGNLTREEMLFTVARQSARGQGGGGAGQSGRGQGGGGRGGGRGGGSR